MGVLGYLVDFVLHIDKHLGIILQDYGIWTYVILFLIIFCETGLVVTPFLPGDSLIFAAGAFAGIKSLNIVTLYFTLCAAAVLGNMVNYFIGRFIGPKIAGKEDIRFIKKEYLDKTHGFYEKHGGKTLIITRFMPIIRTFSPFVAGLGQMKYSKFTAYNLAGGISWVTLFAFAGYFFGNFPPVKENFTFVIYAIVIISLLPAVVGAVKTKLSTAKNQ